MEQRVNNIVTKKKRNAKQKLLEQQIKKKGKVV